MRRPAVQFRFTRDNLSAPESVKVGASPPSGKCLASPKSSRCATRRSGGRTMRTCRFEIADGHRSGSGQFGQGRIQRGGGPRRASRWGRQPNHRVGRGATARDPRRVAACTELGRRGSFWGAPEPLDDPVYRPLTRIRRSRMARDPPGVPLPCRVTLPPGRANQGITESNKGSPPVYDGHTDSPFYK